MMRKKIVAFELEKPLGQSPRLASLQYLAHRHLRVVIRDAPRNSTEELEPFHMSFPKGLGAFAFKRLHKNRVTVRQRHHEESHLAQLPVHLGQGVAKIHLRLARSML